MIKCESMKYLWSERVNIIGTSDGIENGMSDLPIGAYTTVVTSSTGEQHIGMFPNYIGYGNGKSILLINQSEAFDLVCHPKPQKHGGEQKIVTPEGFVCKLATLQGWVNIFTCCIADGGRHA